jgi:hypothetical protein
MFDLTVGSRPPTGRRVDGVLVTVLKADRRVMSCTARRIALRRLVSPRRPCRRRSPDISEAMSPDPAVEAQASPHYRGHCGTN